jgi:hypothetical protein
MGFVALTYLTMGFGIQCNTVQEGTVGSVWVSLSLELAVVDDTVCEGFPVGTGQVPLGGRAFLL